MQTSDVGSAMLPAMSASPGTYYLKRAPRQRLRFGEVLRYVDGMGDLKPGTPDQRPGRLLPDHEAGRELDQPPVGIRDMTIENCGFPSGAVPAGVF